MNRTWKLSDLELSVLWEDLNEGYLPQPLLYTSRTPSRDEHRRWRAEARERLRMSLDPEVHHVLNVMARPDIRVQVRGLKGADPEAPENLIRMLGVRRGDDGYIVVQLPGETVDHSGGYVIAEVGALRLADGLVERLPDIPAGRERHIVLPVPGIVAGADDKLDETYDSSPLWDSFEPSSSARAEDFLRADTEGLGNIVVAQGVSRFGPRGRIFRYLEWRDVVDDGRYIITGLNPPNAEGANAKRMVAAVNAEIVAVVRSIKDQRY